MRSEGFPGALSGVPIALLRVARLPVVPLLLAVLALLGCAHGGEVRARADSVEQAVEAAAGLRAYQCAPRELALARSHLTFVRIELRQGDHDRALEHLLVAESQVGAALRLAQTPRCAAVGPAGGAGNGPIRSVTP